MVDVQVQTDRLPVPVAAPGQLFGHAHTFGVAHDLERMRQGYLPPARTPRVRTRPRLRRNGPLRRWLAASGPVDLWHRVRCRAGYHEFRFAVVDRRCRWCDAPEPNW